MNGGPALHRDDKQLVLDGSIPLDSLITIRKGELVHHPIEARLLAARQELVKISGTGKSWVCRHYDAGAKECRIYDRRPQACRLLKCWDSGEVEALIEQDTLDRLDLIQAGDPLYQAVIEHEARYPCPDLEILFRSGRADDPEHLESLANREIVYRTAITAQHRLTLRQELFYFGRPLFQLYRSVGASVRESGDRLVITWPE
jgi:Fe-S-cluster containining protein